MSRFFKIALAIYSALVLVSCVKDVDFDQAEDITLQPEIQADLLIFDIDQKEFIDLETNLPVQVIRDTVRLEFLDDDYIQDDLVKVEFSYRYRNAFPQSFNNKVSFLSESNILQHQVDFITNGSPQGEPIVTEKIDVIELANIDVIKRSIKMVVEIEVIPNGEPFFGQLSFESKGLFSFQF